MMNMDDVLIYFSIFGHQKEELYILDNVAALPSFSYNALIC